MKIDSYKPYFKIQTSDEYTHRGGTTYIAQIEHTRLKVHRTIKDKDEYFLRSKVQAQFNKWGLVWEKISLKEQTIKEKAKNQATADIFYTYWKSTDKARIDLAEAKRLQSLG